MRVFPLFGAEGERNDTESFLCTPGLYQCRWKDVRIELQRGRGSALPDPGDWSRGKEKPGQPECRSLIQIDPVGQSEQLNRSQMLDRVSSVRQPQWMHLFYEHHRHFRLTFCQMESAVYLMARYRGRSYSTWYSGTVGTGVP